MNDDVRIIEVEGAPSRAVLEQLTQVNQTIFGFNETVDHLRDCFSGRRSVLVLLVLRDEEPVAFKAGFSDEPGVFESWRGGVVESARRTGLARCLMDRQHAWCASQGFESSGLPPAGIIRACSS